jgi:hypothetical protein
MLIHHDAERPNVQTLTITANGADAKGKATTFVTVWDKQ